MFDPILTTSDDHPDTCLGDLRHAVRARLQVCAAAANGGKVGRFRRQEDLYVRAPRWPGLARRHPRHRGGLCGLDPSLGPGGSGRTIDHGAGQGYLEKGRQDLHNRAQGAAGASDRHPGEPTTAPIHHAREGRESSPNGAGDREYRIGAVQVQSRSCQAGRELHLRPQ